MIADELSELDKKGKLKLLLRAGVIPVKVKCQFDIYNYFQVELFNNRNLKHYKTQSAFNTAEVFKVDIRTVWRAVKIMSL